MRSFSADNAKTRLSALLDAVATGEAIEFVRRGKPAAHLVPVDVFRGFFEMLADLVKSEKSTSGEKERKIAGCLISQKSR